MLIVLSWLTHSLAFSVLFGMGATLILGYFYFRYQMSDPSTQQDFIQFQQLKPARDRALHPFVRNWFWLMGTILILLLITLRISETSIGHTHWWQSGIDGEDGFWENLEVLILVVAAAIYLWYFIHQREWPSKLTLVMVCGYLLFLVAASGEESDWGQVWFGFPTPKIMQEHTVEHTTALHELIIDGTDLNTVANIAVHWLLICYGIILPILAFLCADLHYALNRLRLPIPHAAFSIWAVAVLLLEIKSVSTAILGVPPGALPWSPSETRETILYLLLLGAVLYSTKAWTFAIQAKYGQP